MGGWRWTCFVNEALYRIYHYCLGKNYLCCCNIETALKDSHSRQHVVVVFPHGTTRLLSGQTHWSGLVMRRAICAIYFGLLLRNLLLFPNSSVWMGRSLFERLLLAILIRFFCVFSLSILLLLSITFPLTLSPPVLSLCVCICVWLTGLDLYRHQFHSLITLSRSGT